MDEALARTGTDAVWEFGAGSGALAVQLLEVLGERLSGYHIVELSASLRERQAQALQRWQGRVTWHDRLPPQLHGVVLGNELLDAMPVQLLHWTGQRWQRARCGPVRGWRICVAGPRNVVAAPGAGVFRGRHRRRDSCAGRGFCAHPGRRTCDRGAAFFIDYGFPEGEYYHPQRVSGTLMCHRGHRIDDNPLLDVGLKDITAHVNFSAIALAAQDAGLTVLGYTSQARFLFNCGLADRLQDAGARERNAGLRLVNEHEMGELFKVIGLVQGEPFEATGFAEGDRSHML